MLQSDIPALGAGLSPSTVTYDQFLVSKFITKRSFRRFAPSQPPKMYKFYFIKALLWFALGGGGNPSALTFVHLCFSVSS